MKKSWQISLFLLLILSLLGVIVSGKNPFELDPKIVPGDVAWMLTSTALVLLMTPGLAFFYGGMIQPKNIISTMLQSFVAMGIVSIIWVLFGFSLAFGDSIGPEKYGFIGNPFTFFMFKGVGGNVNAALAPTIPLALFAIFQMKFAIITPALITGSFAGSALAANAIATVSLMNTNIASAAAMIGFILFDVAMGRKPTAMGAAIGLVVGLVAITPAAGYVNIGAAIFIGLAASFVCNIAISYRSKTSLDDTLDVFPAHGMGGIIGMLLTAVFAQGVGLFYGEYKTFLFHLLALIIVGVYTFGGSYVLYVVTNKIIPLRVSPKSERLGLDITQHDESYVIEHVKD
jgi:ammonia channel protein AmtB